MRTFTEPRWNPETLYERNSQYFNRDPFPRIPIAKWHLKKFSGEEKDLVSFLAQVHHFAVAERTNEEELFRSRVHLFSGAALDWVLTTPLVNWEHLVLELTRYVSGDTTEWQRLRRIENLRQEDESSAMFISRMELQFQSLRRPMSETDKIEMIIGGLKQKLREAIAGNTTIRTVQDLRAATQQVERRLPRSTLDHAQIEGSVKTNIVGETNVINVDAFTSDKGIVGTSGIQDGRQWRNRGRSRSSIRPKENDGGDNIFCYNCGQKGHISLGCRNPSKVLCYGCGKEGVTRRECDSCSGNAKTSQ